MGLVRVCGLCCIVVSEVVASVVVSTCLAPRCVHHVAATANVVPHTWLPLPSCRHHAVATAKVVCTHVAAVAYCPCVWAVAVYGAPRNYFFSFGS